MGRTLLGVLTAFTLLAAGCTDKAEVSSEGGSEAVPTATVAPAEADHAPLPDTAAERAPASESINPAGFSEPDIRGLRAALEPAKRDIPGFCEDEPRCVEAQKEQLGYFINMMLAFEDPGQRTAKRCMLGGKGTRYIDWQKAADCMRDNVRGRPIGG